VAFPVKTFLKLKHARDVLLDPKQKSEYDKKLSHELMARKRQLEREAELTSKRKRMRDGAFSHVKQKDDGGSI
jgi:hypothetical protein